MQIEKATRVGTPPLISLWGPSSSGKTYTALHMARGIAGPEGKIGLIDTENHRAKLYAEKAGGWFHLDLQPPFGPERYTQAMKAFEDEGDFDCIIVDSMSHVWEGEGGVLDIAEGIGGTGLRKWAAPKIAYKRMMNSILRAPVPVIFCLRAKEAVEQHGKGQNAEIKSMGLTPICGKGFIYEMTISVLLGHDHKPVMSSDGPIQPHPLIPAVKFPEDLNSIVRPGEYLGVKTGEMIRRWVDDAEAFDHERARTQKIARDVATMGHADFDRHWKSLTKEERAHLIPIGEELKALYQQADAERARQNSDEYDNPLGAPESAAEQQ